jgi:hypothetical protein
MRRVREWCTEWNIAENGSGMRILAFCAIAAIGCSTPQKQPDGGRPPAGPPAVKITHFYASPGIVAPGENFLICYGVENARTVSISPAVEPIKPVYNRCISATARSTTTYTLSAEGEGGSTSNSLVVKVERKPAGSAGPAAAQSEPQGMIQLFAASSTAIRAGQPVTLCYGLSGAKSARIEPQVGTVPVMEKHCVRANPATSTTYTLIVESQDGRTEREQLKIAVQP